MKKIPDHARLVFKGKLHDVYQWDQEMFDGSTAIFEAIRRGDAATVIAVTRDGGILFNEEEQPGRPAFESFPGGSFEEGLSPLENAKRELSEETGYVSDDWEPWQVIDILGAAKIEWNNHFFIARNCVKVNEPKPDAGEKIKTKIISFDEFLALPENPKVRNKDIFPYLEKARLNSEEKEKLRKILGL